jgi:hypothetical protein
MNSCFKYEQSHESDLCVLKIVMLLKGFTMSDLRHILREAMTSSLYPLSYHSTLSKSKVHSLYSKQNEQAACQHRQWNRVKVGTSLPPSLAVWGKIKIENTKKEINKTKYQKL